jgi:hypothetical protein
MKQLRTSLNSVYFHQIWFSILLLAFLVGAGVLGRNIYHKIGVLKQVQDLNITLTSKEDSLDDLRKRLTATEDAADFLRKELSLTQDIVDYMLKIVTSASSAGYSVKRFIPATDLRGDSGRELTLVFSGNKDPVKLVEAIEGLNAAIQVEDTRIEVSREAYTINMHLIILSSEGVQK